MIKTEKINKRTNVLVVFFFTSILLLSYYSPGDSFFRVHDYLDHYFVLQKLWAEQIGLFDFDGNISNVFGGLNGNLIGFNDFSLIQTLLKIFDPFMSLVIHDVVCRVLGFIGVILLLNMITKSVKPKNNLFYFFALIFALFPTVPSYTSTFQSFPLMTFLVIKYIKSPNLKLAILLFIFSQNISFVYGGFAFYLSLIIISIQLLYFHKIRIKLFLLIQITVITIFTFTNLRILHQLFLDLTQTQRSEWLLPSPSFKSEIYALPIKLVKSLFLLDPNCGFTYGSPIILLLGLTVYGWVKYTKLSKNLTPIKHRKYCGFFLVIVFLFVFFHLNFFATIKFKSATFQLSRGYIFVTFVYLIFLFTIISKLIDRNILSMNMANVFILIAVVSSLLNYYPVQAKIQNAAISISIENPSILKVQERAYRFFSGSSYEFSEFRDKILGRKIPTLIEYYYVEEPFNDMNYKELKNDGGILSIGINPMVLAWSGWNVFNGYVFNYPLQHKKDFIAIVEGKMDYDLDYKKYIENWGNRLSLTIDPKDYSLYGIDLCKAKSFGVNYLLSDKMISVNKSMELYRVFGKIYVYRIAC